MNPPVSKALTNYEVVLLAVYLLGGETSLIETEDIAVKVNELAPGAFTWKKYPGQINLEIVRVVLSNLRRSEDGNLLIGKGKDGWMLTERGHRLAQSFSDNSSRAGGSKTPLSQKEKLLPLLPGFRWLDESSGWFWIENTPRNSLLTQIRKILAASPSIDVGELRAGVGRHHRKKGFAPPRRVLLELCRQMSWCRVERERITAAAPLNPNEILSDSEQIILKVLKEHGPVIQRAPFEQLCLGAGMNHHSFWVFLSYCPLICRHASSVYGLRGAEVPVGLVESLVPKRTAKSKLLIDYGWTGDRNVQILYRISEGMLTNGIVSIPAAMKAFVQGRCGLTTDDNSQIGTLAVKGNSGWGLGPFFTRRGGEPGDYLSIVFDLSQRVATVQELATQVCWTTWGIQFPARMKQVQERNRRQ